MDSPFRRSAFIPASADRGAQKPNITSSPVQARRDHRRPVYVFPSKENAGSDFGKPFFVRCPRSSSCGPPTPVLEVDTMAVSAPSPMDTDMTDFFETGSSQRLGASNEMPMVVDDDSSSVASSTTVHASSVGRSSDDLRDDDDSLSDDYEELCDRGQELLDDIEQMSEIIALVGVDLETMENLMNTLSSYSDYEARLALFERLRNRVNRMNTRLRNVETGVAALNTRAAELGVTVETFNTGADTMRIKASELRSGIRVATLDLRLRISNSRCLEKQRTHMQHTDRDRGIVPTQTMISTTFPVTPSTGTPFPWFPISWNPMSRSTDTPPVYATLNALNTRYNIPSQRSLPQKLTIVVATVLSVFV
ncbi:hypothetical protein E4T39_08868 [Aureobasidium subglaciale]|nr:hypothetical protein E4T39_08868 [Aureobasidium subglaciale]